MDNEKFDNILRGKMEPLTQQEVIGLGAYCSSKNLSLQDWISISLTLYQDSSQLCYQFLLFVEKHELSRNSYKDFIHQGSKIKIFNNLAVLTIAKALRQSNKEKMEKVVSQAHRFLSSSQKLNMTADINIIFLRGFLFYYTGELSKAMNVFKKSFEELNHQASKENLQHKLSTVSLLTIAQINFVQKNYSEALSYYKKALIQNKNLPVNARFGMAYCFYELEKYQMAEMCFKRILSLSPKSVDALIGMAVIRYKDQDMAGYFQYLAKAYELNNKHPLVLLHLAEHYFVIGEHEKSKEICRRGFIAIDQMPKFVKVENNIRNDYQQYRARFNNILAQILHSNQQYEQAIKLYLQAQGRNLPHNEVGLAQAYIYTNMLKDSLNILEKVYKGANNKQMKQIGVAHKTMAFLLTKVPKSTDQNGCQYYYKQSIKYGRQDYESYIDYASFLGADHQKKDALRLLLDAKKIQEDLGKRLKPELMNSIGVYQLQTDQVDKAISSLQKCCALIEDHCKQTNEDQVKRISLKLSAYFNLAVAYERNYQFLKAMEIHEKVLTFNKYYIDSYVQLAYLLYKVGQSNKAYALLEEGISTCQPYKSKQAVRLDKLITLKGFLQHSDGSNGEARQTLKQLSKMKHLYNQLYELSLNYESMLRKQVGLAVMKDFLRPNRTFCMMKCKEDPYDFYSHMILVILLLTDRKISNEQGLFYFNCLKLAEIDFPIILYNFGIFKMFCEDYSGAIFSFQRYNQKTGTNKAGELIALCHLLNQNFEQSLKVIKINLLRNPLSIKSRFQYAYTIEKKVQKLFEGDGRKDINQLKNSSKNLTICFNIYKSLSKISAAEKVRVIDNPDMKEKTKSLLLKIRAQCDDRRRFVESQLDYYQKKEKEIIDRQNRLNQEQERNLEKIRKARQNDELLARVLSDSDDEEARKKKEKQEKKRAMFQYLEEKTKQVFQKRRELEENMEEEEKKKPKKGANKKNKKRESTKKMQEKRREFEQKSESQPQFVEEPQYEQPQIQYSEQKKPKKHKNKKKHHKEKVQQKYEEDDDREGSNLAYELMDDHQDEEHEKPRKRRKNQDQDNDDIDFDKFLL